MCAVAEQQYALPLDMDEGPDEVYEQVHCQDCGDTRLVTAEAPARATQRHLCGTEEWDASLAEVGKLLLVTGEEITSPDRERALSTARLPVP